MYREQIIPEEAMYEDQGKQKRELLSGVWQAHKRYTERLEEEKMEVLRRNKKRGTGETIKGRRKGRTRKGPEKEKKAYWQKKHLQISKKSLREYLEKANTIFEEANKRLTLAIKATDFNEHKSLLEVAQTNVIKQQKL